MTSVHNLASLLAGRNVDDISDPELRVALMSLGQSVGPITGTTRDLYKKKLETLVSSKQLGKPQIQRQQQQQQQHQHQRAPLSSRLPAIIVPHCQTTSNKNRSQGLVTQAQQPTHNRPSIAATVIGDDAEPNLISMAILIVLVSFFVGLFSLYTYSRFQKDIMLMQSFKNAFRKIILLNIIAMAGYVGYRLVRRYHERRNQESAKIYELVEKSLELLQSPDNPRVMPVLHIRDTLMTPNERKTSKMIYLWDKTVKFIEEHESRVKVELVNIDGENFRAWKWLGNSTLGGAGRMSHEYSNTVLDGSDKEIEENGASPSVRKPREIEWQGSALDEIEDVSGVMAKIEHPTKFLKIRNMFDQDTRLAFPKEWKSKVKEAILKKCGNIITHMEIDATSDEGLVYAKFDSEASAKQAYYKLHGHWCDKKLVNAKFLLGERYYQRFPEAEKCNTLLKYVPQKSSGDQ